MTIPETPLSLVRFTDKWTHSFIYLALDPSINLEYLRNTKQPSPKFIIVWVWLMPTIMGGLIEVLQSHCTNGSRNGEWLDFFADAIGSTVAVLTGILLVRYHAKA